ncbi:NAD(P)/FAD-dependent oxidoreductase [Chromobacterium subtsugae]|uniref:NAD(P)/FAD-dependent oxidoreductase n=1 Tax=Chromobacterium subtsugae TaxID=251747 RepID=UPI000B2BA97B|nr:FAD-dependent monooxygenase [Chromobacterium subtsugae]
MTTRSLALQTCDVAEAEAVRVAVIGAGVAGCAASLSLLACGVDGVLMLDSDSGGRADRVGECLPPSCAPILQSLGVWNDFLAQGHLPSVGSAACWGRDGWGFNDFLIDPHRCGWHLDRQSFDASMLAAAQQRGARLWKGCRLRGLARRDTGGWLLDLEREGQALMQRADFVLDASGAAAVVARRLGVMRNEIDCLNVSYAYLHCDDAMAFPARSWLEAVENGWWYAAGVPGGRIVAAYATDRKNPAKPQGPVAWMAALQSTRHLWPVMLRARPASMPGAVRVAAAPSAILSNVAGRDWLAVGDAACSYDPLTAHGILKALQDGEAAGRAVANDLGGNPQAMHDYQNGIFTRFSDYLRLRNRLYSEEARWRHMDFWARPLTQAARGAGGGPGAAVD